MSPARCCLRTMGPVYSKVKAGLAGQMLESSSAAYVSCSWLQQTHNAGLQSQVIAGQAEQVLHELMLCTCRGHGDTLLLRLNVTAQSGGTLEATLSVQQQGFFPYRLDNFSSETLHVR